MTSVSTMVAMASKKQGGLETHFLWDVPKMTTMTTLIVNEAIHSLFTCVSDALRGILTLTSALFKSLGWFPSRHYA